jgi:hypothetical protein
LQRIVTGLRAMQAQRGDLYEPTLLLQRLAGDGGTFDLMQRAS